MPSRVASASVRFRLHATTFIPKACARAMISRPIWPSPTMPSVRPCRPRALEYSPLFHCAGPELGGLVRDPPVAGEQQSHHQFRHRNRVLPRAVGHEDAEARGRRHVDRVDARRRPGSTRLRLAPDLSAAADTRVPRTMRICGSTRSSAPGSVSAPRSGCDSTSQPSSFRPSMPIFSNLSAMRTRIAPSGPVTVHRSPFTAVREQTIRFAASARTTCSSAA